MTRVAAHPETGEVLDDQAARLLAIEARAVLHELREARDLVTQLEARHAHLTGALAAFIGVDQALDAGSFSVVVSPGYAGRRQVNKGVAQEHAEVLESLGLGRTVTEYRPPTLADLNKRRKEVVAAGVPIRGLIDEPMPGPPKVEIVEKETH